MLTAVVTRWAICAARGPSSMLKKTCSQAPRLTSINAASNRKERLNRPNRNRDVAFFNHLCGCGIMCRSEEHTSELQSLMRISYAVFCLKKKKSTNTNDQTV